jgi:hypothetical protein
VISTAARLRRAAVDMTLRLGKVLRLLTDLAAQGGDGGRIAQGRPEFYGLA